MGAVGAGCEEEYGLLWRTGGMLLAGRCGGCENRYGIHGVSGWRGRLWGVDDGAWIFRVDLSCLRGKNGNLYA